MTTKQCVEGFTLNWDDNKAVCRGTYPLLRRQQSSVSRDLPLTETKTKQCVEGFTINWDDNKAVCWGIYPQLRRQQSSVSRDLPSTETLLVRHWQASPTSNQQLLDAIRLSYQHVYKFLPSCCKELVILELSVTVPIQLCAALSQGTLANKIIPAETSLDGMMTDHSYVSNVIVTGIWTGYSKCFLGHW